MAWLLLLPRSALERAASVIGTQILIVAGLAALLIAWLTVSYQSIKVATANPVVALRSE